MKINKIKKEILDLRTKINRDNYLYCFISDFTISSLFTDLIHAKLFNLFFWLSIIMVPSVIISTIIYFNIIKLLNKIDNDIKKYF